MFTGADPGLGFWATAWRELINDATIIASIAKIAATIRWFLPELVIILTSLMGSESEESLSQAVKCAIGVGVVQNYYEVGIYPLKVTGHSETSIAGIAEKP